KRLRVPLHPTFRSGIPRTRGHPADRARVELLHPIERTRDGFVFNRSDGAQRDELIVRPANVNIFQLLRVQPIDALDLRNHLVTAPFDVESIDVIPSDASREVGAYLLHVEAERCDFVMIENDRRLRLVDLRVDVAELEYV